MEEQKIRHEFTASTDAKAPNLLERAKEGVETAFHHPKHDKETHGTSDDIDKNTPTDEVKGPSVAQRMKEELEAFVSAVIPKKDNE